MAQPSPDPDPWFGTDKALHFGAGLGFSAVGYGIGAWALDDRWAGVALGTGLALGVGTAKEGLDAAGLGSPSWRDFVWVAVGTALGLGVSVTFDAALRGAEL
jgi:putative lipoprotein